MPPSELMDDPPSASPHTFRKRDRVDAAQHEPAGLRDVQALVLVLSRASTSLTSTWWPLLQRPSASVGAPQPAAVNSSGAPSGCAHLSPHWRSATSAG